MKWRSLRIAMVVIMLLCIGVIAYFWHRNSVPSALLASKNRSQGIKTNLQLVLEGPFAVCANPPDHPQQYKILIPKADDHFDPGLDADINAVPLCRGDYSLELGEPKARRAEVVNVQSRGRDIVFDTIPGDCPKNPERYLSLLVDEPDQIVPWTPTTATINGTYANGQEQEYASRMLLRYYSVDTDKIKINKISPGECKIPVKWFWFFTKKIKVDFPWYPWFANLGGDVRLMLSVMPDTTDNITHSHAKEAYRAITAMLGVDRKVDFPSPEEQRLGPHNDCRAPQMLVKPLEATPNSQLHPDPNAVHPVRNPKEP